MSGRYANELHNYFQNRNMPHSLSWVESSAGPSNAIQWTVSCKENGVVIGTGTASQIKVAKEAAAKQALQALGVLV